MRALILEKTPYQRMTQLLGCASRSVRELRPGQESRDHRAVSFLADNRTIPASEFAGSAFFTTFVTEWKKYLVTKGEARLETLLHKRMKWQPPAMRRLEFVKGEGDHVVLDATTRPLRGSGIKNLATSVKLDRDSGIEMERNDLLAVNFELSDPGPLEVVLIGRSQAGGKATAVIAYTRDGLRRLAKGQRVITEHVLEFGTLPVGANTLRIKVHPNAQNGWILDRVELRPKR
jgi:hypothetical protein